MYDQPSNLPTLNEDIETAEASCRHVLEIEYLKIANGLHGFPQDPNSWFEVLRGIPDNRACKRLLGRLKADVERVAGWPPGGIERYGVLQACLIALPRLASLPLHESVSREFCATIRRIAFQPQNWIKNFDYESDQFEELARIVTLRRFHAGQSSFDIIAAPRKLLLRVHPLALPGLVREIFVGLGGLGPIVMPHLNYWRANPTMLLRQENKRAMLRIARSMERQPSIKGLVAVSWLYSVSVGDVSPHLTWVRDFYLENGAYLVDMHLSSKRSGFMIGSQKRRRLYAEGKFRPRETLVLWRRQEILAWAERNATGGDDVPLAAEIKKSNLPAWRFNANEAFSSGQLTLVNCERFLSRYPRSYAFSVFVVPSIFLAVVTGMTLGIWSVLPAIILGGIGMWLFQYFFLQ
jgi:hypothetical protein